MTLQKSKHACIEGIVSVACNHMPRPAYVGDLECRQDPAECRYTGITDHITLEAANDQYRKISAFRHRDRRALDDRVVLPRFRLCDARVPMPVQPAIIAQPKITH